MTVYLQSKLGIADSAKESAEYQSQLLKAFEIYLVNNKLTDLCGIHHSPQGQAPDASGYILYPQAELWIFARTSHYQIITPSIFTHLSDAIAFACHTLLPDSPPVAAKNFTV